MIIGVPKETKIMEGRVGLTPDACAQLVNQDFELVVEHDAGLLSGYTDQQYQRAGARLVSTAEALYEQATLIVKVKEPIAPDLKYIKAHHRLFCFLHLAANLQLAKELCKLGCTAIAFESVEINGQRPILAPMSKIAGRLSVQIGSHLLHQSLGGKGVLLGGVDDSDKGQVVILGAGIAGQHAAEVAACLGAEVTIFDIDKTKLKQVEQIASNIHGQLADQKAIETALLTADLVVGAVLLPDKHTPRLVTEKMLKSMQKGSVIVDIAIDQGGCVENIHPTTYESPTYIAHEITHFAVTNMPGAVPRTASQVLSSAILPFVMELADETAVNNKALVNAVNISAGKVVLPALTTLFSSTNS